MTRLALVLLTGALMLPGCGDSSDEDGNNGANNGTNNGTNNGANNGTNNDAGSVAYAFDSRFEEGASSVSYSGQVARQVLIVDLAKYMGGLTAAIDNQSFTPTDDGQVVAALDFYFRFDSDSNGEEELFLTTEPGSLQGTYASISSGKDLVSKLAGNDSATDHRDWSTEFSGWSDESIAAHGGSISSPEGLVTAFFETVEENAIGHADGDIRMAYGATLPVTVTEQGHDLAQLTQKLLIGAVAFSQGADDYLDDDTDGKGLLAANEQDEDKPYTKLEHAWDEGFGYFGAARDYDAYTDDEIAGKGGRDDWQVYHDSNGDGAIDLTAEYNFGASTNAAKRDRGSQPAAATDFSGDAFSAFVGGRAVIAAADGPLTEAQLEELKGYRDQAIGAWERALAATVVHYINDTLGDMDKFDTDEYDFLAHAKHWSEMKGFALAFQFNPRSPLSADKFGELHTLLGDAPALPDTGDDAIGAYRDNLLTARTLLKDSYGFADANVEGW